VINTPDEIRLFEKSTMWGDIVTELDMWLEEIRNQLESDEVLLADVPMLRGSAKAIRNVVNMLPNLAEIASTNQEEEK